MSEMTKTLAYVGTAVVALVAAWFSRPAPATFDSNELVGDSLYDFDPLAARRLRVVSFNSLTGEPQEFEVAQVGNTWSIPSKDNYPADAQDQMADAANAVNGKEVLRVASEDVRHHQLYGVLDPTSQDRNVGEEGVGTKVTIEDDAGNTLADLIIGKEDKDMPDHHFVRPAGRDIVLVAKIDPEKLSTSFADWIEKDLLQLSPWDIQKVQFKDYTLEFSTDGLRLIPRWTRNADMTVAYNDTDSQWTAESLQVFDPAAQEYVEKPLAENEELNSQTLNDLKSALDDLRIVDVAKKPEQLSENLQSSEDFLQNSNDEAIMSLIEHGFAPVQTGENAYEILSSDGEVVVTMKTGVEYVLRFGEVAASKAASVAQDEAEAEPGAEQSQAGDNINRYIFVLARFNEEAIEKPEFETPPPLPEGADDASADAAEATEEAGSGSDEANESADGEAEAPETEPTANAAAEDETSAGDSEAAADDDASTAEDAATAGEDEPASETEQVLAERKRIEEANQRKRDEYENKIKEGKETVQDLNERFGDWYYVVDNAEFKRIHLTRDEIVKVKEATDAAATGGEDTAVDAGGFGTPGGAIPGLPNLPGLLEDSADSTEGEAPATDANDAAPTEEEAAESAEE